MWINRKEFDDQIGDLGKRISRLATHIEALERQRSKVIEVAKYATFVTGDGSPPFLGITSPEKKIYLWEAINAICEALGFEFKRTDAIESKVEVLKRKLRSSAPPDEK